MSFSINTNIASLQAQNYLRTNSDFQQKTINRVTSGLRIISSGDDAAGLAVANGYRSDEAVLTQGIRNANDGISQLQIVDGGMNNISQLLDRARTLATQSASGTFTGDRGVLNNEFQSVLGEIDRQSQAIGLNTGGDLAKSLSVFVGGGRGPTGAAVIANGAVGVDLTSSTVDAKSLGLKGVEAAGLSTVDLGSGSPHTSVSAIVTDVTNKSSEANQAGAGYTDFYFRGPGFGDSSAVKVSVNLAGVTDTNTLVAAINAAIGSTGSAGGSQAATAFANAGIHAGVVSTVSGSTTTHQLGFSSSSTAFQVEAGDQTANALLGNVASPTTSPTGTSLTTTLTSSTATALLASTAATNETIKVRFQGAGLTSPQDVTLNVTAGDTTATTLASLASQVAANGALKAAGITVQTATPGSALVFANSHGEGLTVGTSGDVNSILGLGSYKAGGSGSYDYTTTTGAGGAFAASAETLEFSVGGGPAISTAITPAAATTSAAADALNTAFASNSTLAAAGLHADGTGAQLIISSSNNTAFRLSTVGATNNLGFGTAGATGVAAGASPTLALAASNVIDSGGANQTGVLAFSAIRNAADTQTVTLTADGAGSTQSLSIVLKGDATNRNATSVDQAINTINSSLQQSNNATLQKITAVKEQSGGAEGIRFISTLSSFQAAISNTASTNGIGSQGTVQTATTVGTGSTADITSQSSAQLAVTALANAVATLGSAQAVVGKGQNQFNYAVNLAQSQVTNLTASESRIRDADLAQEAANLTKAQITLQAGVAALAQANSAPQAILSLLRG
jgi:flagellin